MPPKFCLLMQNIQPCYTVGHGAAISDRKVYSQDYFEIVAPAILL